MDETERNECLATAYDELDKLCIAFADPRGFVASTSHYEAAFRIRTKLADFIKDQFPLVGKDIGLL